MSSDLSDGPDLGFLFGSDGLFGDGDHQHVGRVRLQLVGVGCDLFGWEPFCHHEHDDHAFFLLRSDGGGGRDRDLRRWGGNPSGQRRERERVDKSDL